MFWVERCLYCIKKGLNTIDENFLFLCSSFDVLLILFIVHSSHHSRRFHWNTWMWKSNHWQVLPVLLKSNYFELLLNQKIRSMRAILVETDYDIQPNLVPYPFHTRKRLKQTETFWTRINYFHKNHRLHVLLWVFCVFYFTTIFIYLSNENIGLFILTSFFILK